MSSVSSAGKRVLVTGAAGFIGSNLARSFAGDGYDVIACDRMGQGGKWRNLLDVRLHDLITPEALPDFLAVKGDTIGLVVHMGAISTTTETDIDAIARDNIRFSLDLWDWCRRTTIRFLYASSAATYGNGEAGFEDDNAPDALARLRPLNAYGWSKHIVDRRILADHQAGLSPASGWVGLKFFNVYGPGETHKGDMRSVMNKIIPVVRRGEPVRLFRSYRPDYPDGSQRRDFIFIDDIVAVVRWLMEKRDVSGLFNLGSGQARTWNDLAHAVFTACGIFSIQGRIEYIDMPDSIRAQYQYSTEAPMRRLREVGWDQSFTTLEEGVRQYMKREQRYEA